MKISAGKRAPNFTLLDQDGVSHTLSKYLGKWVLLYFYPKDATPGCTVEAQVLRDSLDELSKKKVVVFGISADSVASHKKFYDKQELNFNLLSDEEKIVINLYGVWGRKKFMGKSFNGILRNSFLIDPQGVITKVYEKVKPKNHAKEIIEDLEELQ